MNPADLMLQAIRARAFGADTAEEYARLTCLPVEVCRAELERSPLTGLNLYPPARRYWMPSRVEVPPTRKSTEREVTEWQTLIDLGRLK